MINKRILIKNLLSHHDENNFYEKKEFIDLKTDKGKGKFLKHVCALSNSNPYNNSFLIVGIEDVTNNIKGIGFIDDSDIQNLANSYLLNPPFLKYENIFFPNLPKEKVVGLLTVSPSDNRTSFKKRICNIQKGAIYFRKGSSSVPIDNYFSINPSNKSIVDEIEKISKISFKELLDDIFQFFDLWHSDYKPQYLVFKDQFVICWAGYRGHYGETPILQEVDIRIINEGVKLFFSAIQFVDVKITESDLNIIEYKVLGFDDNYSLYPYEETILVFHDNGKYEIKTNFLFKPPKFDTAIIKNLYARTKAFENRIIWGEKIEFEKEIGFYEGIANYYLICYFNGISEAKNDLLNSAKYLDGCGAEWRSECVEILEKYEKNGS